MAVRTALAQPPVSIVTPQPVLLVFSSSIRIVTDTMETLGAATSAVALLETAAKVITYINKVNGAKEDRKRLRDQVRAVTNVLHQLTDEADDDEEGHEWRETLEALEASDGPLGRLQVVLSELLELTNPTTGAKKALSSIKWPFKEEQVKDILIAIEREKSLLHLALSNNSRKLLQEIKSTAKVHEQQLDRLVTTLTENSHRNTTRLDEIQTGIGSIRLHQESAEERQYRENILRWLSPLEYSSQQSDFIRRRQPGTGKWLLESPEYESWVNSAGGTLFCPGIPGAGKTILSSVVIEDLFERAQKDPGMAVAFVYCNFNRHVEQSPQDIIGSLTTQLLQQAKSVPPSLRELYDSQNSRRKPLEDEITAALPAVAQLCPRPFVVMDALDECQRPSRDKVLSVLFEIQSKTGINLFMTSRFIPEITRHFSPITSSGRTTVEIRAHEADLRLYLDKEIKSRLPLFVQRNADLQQDIQTAIVEATAGM